jgi:hypothetical protein
VPSPTEATAEAPIRTEGHHPAPPRRKGEEAGEHAPEGSSGGREGDEEDDDEEEEEDEEAEVQLAQEEEERERMAEDDVMAVFRDGLLADLAEDSLRDLLLHALGPPASAGGAAPRSDVDAGAGVVVPLDHVRHLLRSLGFSDHDSFQIASRIPASSRDEAQVAHVVAVLSTGAAPPPAAP